MRGTRWKAILLGCGIFLLSLWWCALKFDWFTSQPVYPQGVMIGNRRYSLEIADTQQEQVRGLSGRESLCQDCALLFIFPEKRKWAFWMKDMRFSIDIMWLAGDTIVGIERNLSPFSKSIFRPEEEADRVIEINAGGAVAFRVGDIMQFEN